MADGSRTEHHHWPGRPDQKRTDNGISPRHSCMLLIRPATPPYQATAQHTFIMSFRMRWVSTISVFLRTAASLR